MNPYAASLAVVTGASSGIGEAIARKLAARRTPLLLVARSGDKLASLAADWTRRFGGRVETLALDLGNPEVPCDVQIIQVDHYRYDGATGTVPDQTTTYAYETGTRPCASCYGREIKTTTTSTNAREIIAAQ